MMADSEINLTTVDDGWAKILDNRAKLGKAWHEHLDEHQRLAKRGCYIRIRGEDFRAISIDNDNPCGRLLDENCSEIKESSDIKSALINADRSSPDKAHLPGNKKGEHKIQAFLIREALLNNLNFCHLFKQFDDSFDELLFVTDEMRFGTGKVRADVIAVGRLSQTYFPVLIELKVGREMKRLEEQLNNAKKFLVENKAIQDRFSKFLCAVSGAKQHINYSKILQKIIWPGSKSGAEAPSVQAARNKGILMAKYSCHEGEYSFELDDPSGRITRNSNI